MKYSKIKNALILGGFKLEYLQTSYELDMLTFENEKINGHIDVFIFAQK